MPHLHSPAERIPATHPWRIMPRLTDVGRVLDRYHLPELITTISCLAFLLLGLDMLRDPVSYAARPTFAEAVGPDGWAAPQVWAVLLIAPCVATLLSLAARRRDVFWPLFAVTAWLCAWSVALAKGADDPDAVSSALIVYTLLATILAAITLVYMREGRARGER